MADLLARFKMVDEMSDKLGSLAEGGQSMVAQFEQAGEAANAAFEGMTGGVASAVSSVDGVAVSIDSLQGAADGAASSADTLSDSMNSYGNAAGEAAAQTDYWTDAVGNYDKSALEAVYSTEELVEMGLKSAAALEEQERMFELCEQSASSLSKSIEATAEIQEELSAAMDAAAEATAELSKNEDVSAETKAALAKASVEAAEAMSELSAAQEEAAAAMAQYDEVMASGTTDLDTLEAAAERAGHAAEALAEANGKASDATEELSKATEKASSEAEEGGERGQKAAQELANALASAGIVKMVLELADAFMEASEAAAEFQLGVMKISTIADTTQVSLSTISDDIMALSMETGDSVNELAEATYSALSASVETASAVEFTATATKLAAGGFTSSATAVDVLTTALNAYGLEASYAENISDMLITTQNLGKTTVDELAASVGKVIPLASAYGVEMDNLSAAYAELTKGGIATAEAGTYLKSMLNELGDSGSTVSTVLMEETGSSFSELMDMGYSLGDVMDVLGTSVGGSAGAFNELWSSSEAGIGALSLYNAGAEQFNTTLDAMQTSAGATAAAYETMNNTTADAAEDLSNAAANLQISIGQQINPLIEKLYGLGTDMLNFMTEFSQEHPVVTKAIAAIGIGVSVAAVALSGFAAVTTTNAIPAVISFGVALNTALGPIGWVALGVTALTAAVAAFIAMNEENLGETEGMTAATRAQYYELQDLNAEYEKACEQYGETSEEALRLKYQVDDLSAAFEANRQTVEEFTAEVDALIQSHDELISSYEENMSAIDQTEIGTLSLIQKLEDLASTTNRTAAQEEQMKAVIDQLNNDLPDLALSYDDVTNSTEACVEAMKKAAEAQAEQERQAEQKQAYVDLLKEQANLEDEIAKAEENVRLEQERMDNMSGWDHFWTGGEWDDLEAYQDALDQLNAAYAENQAALQGIESDWEEVAQAAEEAAQSPASYEEAVSVAYENVRAKVEELCAAYDEAYQAALESFEGQFGLFDEAEANMEATVANAQAALESQLAYWESYGANIETLKNTSASDLGITQENYEALMAYAQSGSEEAAGLAASMAEAINSGNADAVAELANTAGEVSEKQQEIAAMTADWQTDFTAQMDAIEKEMQDTIDGMDLSEEASAAASSTISSYADQIRAGKSGAVAAAQEVANAVTAALSSANTTVNVRVNTSGSVPGHASGTTNAESVFLAGEEGPELVARPAATYATGTTDSADYFIAGENGPELIVGQQGSTVFPTGETDRLIAALNEKRQPLQVISGGDDNHNRGNAAEQVKRILLEIAGSGTIEVNGGADKATILEILTEYLKPVLMKIIQNEIYEEGELSYEY